MSSSILDAREASLYLKITPELLFHYVRYGAKGRDGGKLPTADGLAATRFSRDELEAYDAYLREPWPSPDGTRAPIPKGVRDYLKIESGGMCARCGEGAPLHDAHIIDWETSRSNHHHNLLRLCGNCHGKYDTGVILRSEIERIKAGAVDRVQRRIAGTRRSYWPIAAAPPMTPRLLGRDTELSEAVDALRSGESLSILGLGGIGKTQLALHALRTAIEERPIVWIGVDILSGSSTVADALVAQARAAGIEFEDGRPLFDEARACVVFDGIERLGRDQDEVADLLERLLADCTDTLIFVTSQVSVPWLRFDRELRLGPLDEEASIGLLDAYVDGSSLQPATTKLLQFADGHPLTLRILAALIRHFGGADGVVERLERLGAEAVSVPRRRQHSERTSLVHCLDLAYSLLSVAERRLLWLVALSPGGLRPGFHDMDRLVGNEPVEAAAELHAWNLIDMVLDDAFEQGSPARVVLSMLAPIRAFVMFAVQRAPLEEMADLQIAFCENVTFLVRFIQNELLKGNDVAAGKALMERELPNAIAAFDLAADHVGDRGEFQDVVTGLANATMMIFFTSGRFEAGQLIMKRASATAARLGSLKDAIQFLHQMQVLAERAFNREAAAFALAEAERIGSDAEGEPLALLRLLQASAAEVDGDHERAIKLARESYDTLQELNGPEGEWVRSAGFQLARALEFSGRPAEALPFYVSALAVAEAEGDPINRGSILHHIGNCEAYAERWQAAMHAYRKAAEQFVELEAVEFISNALGEAGTIVPQLDPLIGLPGRGTIIAGLDDIVEQIGLLLSKEMFGGRNPRVTFRKFGGIVSLALHTGNRDLLRGAADEMYHRFIHPLDQHIDDRPDWFKILIFHTQWMIRFLQFLSFGIDRERPLSPGEFFVLAQLASNAFVVDLTSVSEWLASYLRRRCEMPDMTSGTVLRTMKLDKDEIAVRQAREQAAADGVDLDWLGKT